MSLVPRNDKETKPKANRRRRKKRRTEDFSDSSSDDSSSDEQSDKEVANEEQNENNNKDLNTLVDNDEDIVLSDSELPNQKNEDFINVSTKLKKINLTKTALNETSNLSKLNLNSISKNLSNESNELQNSYLNLMFKNFGDDVNELRKAPDFSEKNLIVLANVLKNGANIFDQDTLKAIVNE
ncbi:hypothetical protein WICMUC_002572 [Wickerhamomyces mucosus]|uniref:Ribosome assembly protein 3 n=1 Tax=Wickerhamomyces mucosus TaxID=1378264 RepID=A0A9P8PQ53_9ASCO|nr:hypothetical protein WICMUC_002572 [Wickerhamomyces mucosus]